MIRRVFRRRLLFYPFPLNTRRGDGGPSRSAARYIRGLSRAFDGRSPRVADESESRDVCDRVRRLKKKKKKTVGIKRATRSLVFRYNDAYRSVACSPRRDEGRPRTRPGRLPHRPKLTAVKGRGYETRVFFLGIRLWRLRVCYRARVLSFDRRGRRRAS